MIRVGLALVTALSAGTASRAAEMQMDVSTLTCEQLKNVYSDSADLLIAWTVGYAGAKSGSTQVDLQALGSTIEKVETYCDRNPSATLMQAGEAK